jgi:methanol---5-hydroxybenzimidazolylcobamide Co-methyltransferase
MRESVYTHLAIPDAAQLRYGRAPAPVRCGFDLVIGDGLVYPEVNFTLPPIDISSDTWKEVLACYDEMATAIMRRATALRAPGLVLEFELLPALTDVPEWGAEITVLLKEHLRRAYEKDGLKSALRVTPTDMRDQERPPLLRSGLAWEKVKRSFELCIEAGADIVSIESVGGKEVHDRALMFGEVRGMVFALGVLASRDMAWLWTEITALCKGTRAVPGGDSACGFANTAMQLAHQKMLPEVLAAVVRAMGAARSLVAFENGAVGPSKDCAYEGPVLKAITGCPISMEGKSATCAHFSPLGNIAAAVCDLWSNESVQNVRLLSGSAPEAYTESLIYDCRLMNAAAARGGGDSLRDWLTESDEWLSPQAAVLSPAATLRIAEAIVSRTGYYDRTVAAARTAVDIIRDGIAAARMKLSKKEEQWLARMDAALCALPADEGELLAEMKETYGELFLPASYGLA